MANSKMVRPAGWIGSNSPFINQCLRPTVAEIGKKPSNTGKRYCTASNPSVGNKISALDKK
ncbi:hypothetical protein PIPA1_00640 [Pelosinus sp. IPA-1]|nr:hypothetical protein PIPA1_00640 [Pelosinus sp. IPA-1]